MECPNNEFFNEIFSYSPLSIIVCGDINIEFAFPLVIIGCSAATENMLIQAADINIGSSWINIFPEEEKITAIKKLLNLPNGIIPISMSIFGYKAEELEPNNRFHQNKIHYNAWNERF